jgi:hypothetical protein
MLPCNICFCSAQGALSKSRSSCTAPCSLLDRAIQVWLVFG